MDRILKVFCSGAEQTALARKYTVLERYQGFVLVSASRQQAGQLRRQYPLEDITDQYAIRAAGASISTARPRVDAAGKVHAHAAYRNAAPLSDDWHHYLVQFIGPIKRQWLKAIDKAGAEPREHYENFVYVVRIRKSQVGKISALPFVRWVGHLPHRARLTVALERKLKNGKKASALPRTRRLPDRYTVEFFGPDDRQAAVGEIRKIGFKVVNRNARGKFLIVEASGTEATRASRLERLAKVHGVRAVRERSIRRTTNDVSAGIMGTASCMATGGLNLSGEGEVVGVCDTGLDTGDPAVIHPDFAGRIAWIKSYPITGEFNNFISNPGGNDGPADLDSGHGTHVSGSVLGSGAVSATLPGIAKPIRGLAHKARLLFQAVEQELQWRSPVDRLRFGRFALAGIPEDLGVLFGDAYRRQARVHSNSWGGGDPGEYDEQCEQLDRYVWEHRTFCVLFAAGNDGSDSDGDGKINSMSVTSPGTAKNCITVGACENRRPEFNAETYGEWWPKDFPVAPFRANPMADDANSVVGFSSRGPTVDGRIKPDVVAPGTFILSTRSTQIAANNKAWGAFPPSPMYFHMGGTSMATPLTAGAVALIRQYLRKKAGIESPSAALLKATLILGAQRLAGYTPADAILDNHQGYGRVNLDAVLAPASPAKALFRDGKPGMQTGQMRQVPIQVKSNQVPLRVVLAYSDFPGATLVNNLNLIVTDPSGNRYIGNQGAAGATSLDVANNVEVVHVRKPAPGTWNIQIVASNVPEGPQPFAVAGMGHVA